MNTDLSLYEPEYRALIQMVRERLHDDYDKSAVESLSLANLATRLRDLMREEDVHIPAGTAVVPCRWCKTGVCWVRGRYSKYRESIVAVVLPTKASFGEGYPHLADCPMSGLMFD